LMNRVISSLSYSFFSSSSSSSSLELSIIICFFFLFLLALRAMPYFHEEVMPLDKFLTWLAFSTIIS
jgi:hypothetical protein